MMLLSFFIAPIGQAEVPQPPPVELRRECSNPHYHTVMDFSSGPLQEKQLCYQYCWDVNPKTNEKFNEVDIPCETVKPLVD